MALSVGKLSILIGAGLVGSVIAKEGMPNVSGFFSGAYKILKQIKHDDAPKTSAKPQNDVLLAQVNVLREELQRLASNRPLTIVTSTGSGGSKYGIIVVVVVVGYGYVWWKGWKLPDMMFASRRGLADACSSIAKQLETVYSSISATKRHLSSRIDRVDCSLDECGELTSDTRVEVSELKGELKVVGVDVQFVHEAVQTLETKINRIEGKQVLTTEGVKMLVARTMEFCNTRETIQAPKSKPVLELPPISPSSRTESLPTHLFLEPPSPSAPNVSRKVKRPLQSVVSASGLKGIHGISNAVAENAGPSVSNGVKLSEDKNNGNSNSGVFGQRFSGIGASLFTRTMQSFK